MTATDKLLAVLSQLPSSIQWNETSQTVYRVAIAGCNDDDITYGLRRILTRAKFRPTPSEVLLAIAIIKYGDFPPQSVTHEIADAIRLGTPAHKLHPTIQMVVGKTGGLKAWRVEPPVKGQQLQDVINDVLLVRITEYMDEQRSE
jgi:hypothetical protein